MNNLSIIAPENQTIRTADGPLRVIGIDLGTTNSAVAEIVLPPGQPETAARPMHRKLSRIRSWVPTLAPSSRRSLRFITAIGLSARELSGFVPT